MEQLRGNEKVMAALSAVTAAVVGVILNLAIWFGWHVLFPRSAHPDWFALVISVVAFVGLWRWKWSVIPVVLGAGAAGLVHGMFFQSAAGLLARISLLASWEQEQTGKRRNSFLISVALFALFNRTRKIAPRGQLHLKCKSRVHGAAFWNYETSSPISFLPSSRLSSAGCTFRKPCRL
jgi:hypothetical protein